MEYNHATLGAICKGCLSVDRKLTVVLNDEIRSFFTSIIEPLDLIHQILFLCWECIAIINKTLKYKKQVQYAHEYLTKHLLHSSSNLPHLSQLTTKNITQDSHIILNYESQNVLNLSKNVKGIPETDSKKDLTSEYGKSKSEEEPMAFIKIEGEVEVSFDPQEASDHEDLRQDLEGFYVNEDAAVDVDDKDLKAVLKVNPYEYESKTKSKKTRRKTKMEFNDSDDEPLKKRTEDNEEVMKKPRGRRKKNENDENAAVSKKTRRSEKPPGVVQSARVARRLQLLNVPPGRLEMVLLSWEEVEAERQRALSSSSYTRHQHRCQHCALGFNHRAKLDDHMKKHDPAAGDLSCEVCKVRCPSLHSLSAHKRRHRVKWRCCECGELGSRAAVVADHYARAHGSDSPTHTCSVCGHTATSLSKLRNHHKNHAERQNCELCGKTFRDKTSLKTHLFIHKGEKEYECEKCGKRFLFKKAMEIHLVTHDASSHLYCHQCDMNFKNQMSYYQHMKYNLKHIDPARLKYACVLCEKKFAKASRLQEHNLAVHLKATPIGCPIENCQFACASRPVLRSHIRLVHRNQRNVRNYVCHTCGKAYTNKKTLEGHLRSHTGERPFHCVLCPSAFGYEAALYNHNKLVHLKAKQSSRRPPVNPPTGDGPSWPSLPLDHSDRTPAPP